MHGSVAHRDCDASGQGGVTILGVAGIESCWVWACPLLIFCGFNNATEENIIIFELPGYIFLVLHLLVLLYNCQSYYVNISGHIISRNWHSLLCVGKSVLGKITSHAYSSNLHPIGITSRNFSATRLRMFGNCSLQQGHLFSFLLQSSQRTCPFLHW